MKTTKISSTA